MTFHLMSVHIIFSSVWERAAHSVDHVFSLYFVYLQFYLFSFLVLMARFVF